MARIHLKCFWSLIFVLTAIPSSGQVQIPSNNPVAQQLENSGYAPFAFPLAVGKVVKVDTHALRIVLFHPQIVHLDLSEMTMIYRVSNLGLLDGIRPDDIVKFAPARENGQYSILWMKKKLE